MKTNRAFYIVFALFVLSAMLACSFVSKVFTGEGGTGEEVGSAEQSSDGDEETGKPITGNWEQVISNGWTSAKNQQVGGNEELDGYTYFNTLVGLTAMCGERPPEGGAEIWRTRDGKMWEGVVEDGFGNPDNNWLELATWHDRMYVIARGADTFTLWVTKNGKDYEEMDGPWTNDETADLAVINDRLFLFAGSVRNGQGLQAWEISDRDEFKKIFEGGLGDPTSRMAIGRTELPELGGWAYIGIVNNEKGGEVWRSDGGTGWERSLTGGFDDPQIMSVVPHVVFKDHLYASSIHYPNGPNILRTDGGTRWEKVVENAFGLGEHHYSAAFLKEFKGDLYLVFSNDDPRMCGLGEAVVAGEAADPSVVGPSVVGPSVGVPFVGGAGQGSGGGASGSAWTGYSDLFTPPGFTLWRSADGKDWSQIGEPGFGNTDFFWAGPSVVRDYMYICAVNYKDGNKVWRSSDGENWDEFFAPPLNADTFGCAIGELDDSLVYLEGDLSHGANIWRYGE